MSVVYSDGGGHKIEFVPKKKVVFVGKKLVMISAGPRFAKCYFYRLSVPYKFVTLKCVYVVTSEVQDKATELVADLDKNGSLKILYEFLLNLENNINDDL